MPSERPPLISRVLLAAGLGAAAFGAGFVAASGPRSFAMAAACVAAACSAVAVSLRPALGAYVLIAVVPAVSGIGRGHPVPGLRLSELLTVFFGGLLLSRAAIQGTDSRLTRFDRYAILYAVTALVTGTIDVLRGSPGGFSTSNVGTIVGPVQFVVLYFAIKVTLTGRREREVAVKLLVLSGVVVSLIGIAQRARLAGLNTVLPRITDSPITASWSLSENRITSVFPQWQMFSAYEFIVLAVAVNLILRQAVTRRMRMWATGAALLSAACLVETLTLTTTAASLIAVLALSRWNRRLSRMVPALAVIGAGLALVFWNLIAARYAVQYTQPENGLYQGLIPHSFAFRIHVWLTEWLPIITHHLVTGIGPSVPTTGIWTSTESLYVTLLLRGGVFLLAAYACLMIAWYGLAKSAATSPDRLAGTIGQVLVVTVILLVPMQLAEPYFVDTGFPQVLWALAGLVAAAAPQVIAQHRETGYLVTVGDEPGTACSPAMSRATPAS